MRTRIALLVGVSTLFLGGCGVIFGIDAPQHRAAALCGDGVIGGGEGCDDGNSADGDGCDATCQPEAGFNCAGTPSACDQCGDGQLQGREACDDGNAMPGDGCDAACEVEHGFTCEGAPSACAATCGDGVVASTEQCDDGNTTAGDGCEPTCLHGHGYGCVEEPSVCAVRCGDGARGPGEKCDDGNQIDGDGCSAQCTREVGFACDDQAEPTHCAPICGDGLVVPGEGCDDANNEPGDGCGVSCVVEPGFGCSGQPSACAPICGDGVVLAGEECDDHNNVSGDCCSAFCQVEPGCEVEPNGTILEANALAGAVTPVGFTGDGKIRGSIGVIGDEDLFAFDLAPAHSVVRIETFDASGVDCAAGTDTRLTLLNAFGAPIPSRADDDSGIGACSALEINLASGGYFLRVQQADNSAVIPGYTLEVDVQPSAGVDSGSNDTLAQASVFGLTDGFVTGIHQTVADVDFYKLTIPGSSARSLRAEILEGGAESCESGGIRSRLSLFRADSVLLADDDAGLGRGLCSLLDGTGLSPAQPGAHGLDTGVYYLRVMAATGASEAEALFDYRLAVTVR